MLVDLYNAAASILIFTFFLSHNLLQTLHSIPGAYNLMLQSHENAVSEFIHLPASGCLGNTVFISPEESRFERNPLDSGGMKKARSRGRGIRSRSVFSVAIVRGSWSLCAPPGCIPQRRLRPLSSINAICIGIGCNKSCKSLTAEWAPPGADTAEPSLRELWQCVNGIFCWRGRTDGN